MISLRIGQRISLGFCLAIASLMALSAVSLVGLHMINGTYGLATASSGAALAAADLDGDLIKDGSALKDYLSHADGTSAKVVQESMANTAKAAARLQSLTAGSAYAESVGAVVKQQADFVAGFQALHTVVARRSGARDELSLKVGDLTTAFTTLAEKSASTGSLGTIKASLDAFSSFSSLTAKVAAFIAAGAAADEQAADAELKNLTDQLVGLKTRAIMGGLSAEYADVDSKIGDFNTSFAAVRAATADQRKQEAVFLQMTTRILGQSARLREQFDTDFATSNETLKSAISRITLWVVAISAAAALAAVLIAWLVSRGITRPIRAITEVMGRLADRDWSVEIFGVTRGDELGAMAKAVQVFKENGLAGERMQRQIEEERSNADAARRTELRQFADRFQDAVGNVVEFVAKAAGEMQELAEQLMGNVELTKSRSASVATTSQEAAGNVQNVAAAAEELSASVHEIARQVTSSSQITVQAVSETERADTQVQSLAEAAEKIGSVARLIGEIASQTNLLALNATIEAARAGEAGKGFAVVASEVKNLAAQTAKATEEIGAQISAIQNSTNDTVSAIRGIGSTINRVNEIAQSVATAVDEQGAATREIAHSTQQAFSGTQQVAGDVADMSEVVTASGNAAAHVRRACAELAEQTSVLRQEVDRFLTQVRAA